MFSGASPDYSVVAQKAGLADAHAALDGFFTKSFGLSLEQVSHQWDTRFNKIEALTIQSHASAQQAEAKAQQAIDQAQQAQVQAQTLAAQLESTYNSRSWRLTAPLRQLMKLLRYFKQS
jgi:O-antigen chain-terminating methyltransferase